MRNAARLGEQSELTTKALRKRKPSAASRSRLGVALSQGKRPAVALLPLDDAERVPALVVGEHDHDIGPTRRLNLGRDERAGEEHHQDEEERGREHLDRRSAFWRLGWLIWHPSVLVSVCHLAATCSAIPACGSNRHGAGYSVSPRTGTGDRAWAV